MKFKQLRYLAKKSLESTAKTNKTMVIMLSLSMIIIIPVIMLCFGVNVSISQQLNSKPYELSAMVQLFDYRVNTVDTPDDSDYRPTKSGSKHIAQFDKIENKIVYERYHILESVTTSIVVDGQEAKTIQAGFDYNVLDNDKNTYQFPKVYARYGSIFSHGGQFLDNGKKQVIVAESFLEKYGLAASQVIDKNITIFNDNSYGITGYLCKNYKVVGIVKKELRDIMLYDSYMQADLFFCSSNMYDEQGNAMLKPYMDGKTYKVHYPNMDKVDTLNEEYMMPIGVDPVSKDCFGETNIFLEANSYQELTNTINYLGSIGLPYSASTAYINFKKLYDVSWMITFVLGVSGAVLLIVVILNYFINIKHNVNKRKHFLTMMRAVGAKDSEIPKLYMIESNILCTRATLIFAPVATVMCIGIKFLFDGLMNMGLSRLGIVIPWWLVVTIVLATTVAMAIISNIIAWICSYSISKASIINTLKSE